MAGRSSIEWTDATWNPGIYGCKEVSPGCAHCYAVPMAKRLGAMGQPRYAGLTRDVPAGGVTWTGEVRTVDDRNLMDAPLHWRKPYRIFVDSMSDLFHEDVPVHHVAEVWAVMSQAPRHTFQILTKRPERMATIVNAVSFRHMVEAIVLAHGRFEDAALAPWPLPNAWLGTSVESQTYVDERLPHLLAASAAVRFISAEPLLGPIEFSDVTHRADYARVLGHPALEGIDLVIVGGESGPRARPFDLAWARSIRAQCAAGGVAFFLKQLGSLPVETLSLAGFWRVSARPLTLRDRKGGDPSEWPADLQDCRAMPALPSGS